MTPLEIEILLHYWTRPGDYRDGDFTASAVDDAICRFRDHGILKPVEIPRRGHEDQKYECDTEAMKAYVGALCAVPLPTQKWVIDQ